MADNIEMVASEPAIRTRSRVTNGSKTFVAGGDGRSGWARRWRDLIASHANDLGGREMLSEAQIQLIRRASTLEIELEHMEASASGGERLDLDLFGRTVGNLRRVLETIGLERKARPIDGGHNVLAEYFATPAVPAASKGDENA